MGTTDRATLAGDAYADDRNLAARQALYEWQHPRYDLPGSVLEELAEVCGVVIDVGCGNGQYLRRIRVERPDLHAVGLDIAPGILHELAPRVAVADAQRLPFARGSVDAVLALHMLYHVPDIDAGIAELRRVLRPEGVGLVSTNSRTDKQELDQLWADAATDVLGHHAPERVSLSSRFCLEDAPDMLGRHFQHIRVIERPGTVEVSTPDPVVAHLASYRTWVARNGVPFDDILERVQQRVADVIASQGTFTIRCLGGLLICQ